MAEEMISFMSKCHSEFHVVAEVIKKLEDAGFVRISERNDVDWSKVIKPGGKYYFTRNQSTISAFAVGMKYKPGNGFVMAGAHTDRSAHTCYPLPARSDTKIQSLNASPKSCK